MTELAFLSASDLARKISTNQISSTELTKLYIDRIERFDGAINAVVVRIFDEALASAEIADAMKKIFRLLWAEVKRLHTKQTKGGV